MSTKIKNYGYEQDREMEKQHASEMNHYYI